MLVIYFSFSHSSRASPLGSIVIPLMLPHPAGMCRNGIDERKNEGVSLSGKILLNSDRMLLLNGSFPVAPSLPGAPHLKGVCSINK